MGRIFESLVAGKVEMDDDCFRCRRTRDIGVRQYSLLLPQVLRGPGELEERTLQGGAEIVRGADHPKPVHVFAGQRLSRNSGGEITLSVRPRDYTVFSIRSGVHSDIRPTSAVIIRSRGREGAGILVLSRLRAVPRLN